jgi:hypothetical protein
VHALKTPEDWWHIHQKFVQHLAVESLNAALKLNFWDGPYSTTRLGPRPG